MCWSFGNLGINDAVSSHRARRVGTWAGSAVQQARWRVAGPGAPACRRQVIGNMVIRTGRAAAALQLCMLMHCSCVQTIAATPPAASAVAAACIRWRHRASSRCWWGGAQWTLNTLPELHAAELERGEERRKQGVATLALSACTAPIQHQRGLLTPSFPPPPAPP